VVLLIAFSCRTWDWNGGKTKWAKGKKGETSIQFFQGFQKFVRQHFSIKTGIGHAVIPLEKVGKRHKIIVQPLLCATLTTSPNQSVSPRALQDIQKYNVTPFHLRRYLAGQALCGVWRYNEHSFGYPFQVSDSILPNGLRPDVELFDNLEQVLALHHVKGILIHEKIAFPVLFSRSHGSHGIFDSSTFLWKLFI
jgi:hypothetical protein